MPPVSLPLEPPPTAARETTTRLGLAASGGSARVSDADREAAINTLNEAFAQGRVTVQEHGVRLDRIFGARTYADLAAVTADLAPGPLAARASQRLASAADSYPAAAADRRTNPLAVAALVCGLIPGIPQLAAVILGIQALRQIRRGGGQGTALAITGLALGLLGMLLTMIFVLL